jgi:hypothetical protein
MKTALVKTARFLASVGKSLKKRACCPSRACRTLVDLLLLPQDLVLALGPLRRVEASPLQLIRPNTFNGQLARWKFTGRKRRHQIFADKLAVREYVAQRIGAKYLPKLYWAGSQMTSAVYADLPRQFVYKSNHASGHVEIVYEKESLQLAHLQRIGERWLSEDYSVLTGEWQYRWIQPTLLAEEYLGDDRGCPPPDYKMWVFRGRFGFVQVDYDRFSHHTRTFYDRELRALPFSVLYPNQFRSLEAPACFREMIGLAETLASGEKFARVDFYAAGGGVRPIFGEITLSPGCGGEAFSPQEWDGLVWQQFLRTKPAMSLHLAPAAS